MFHSTDNLDSLIRFTLDAKSNSNSSVPGDGCASQARRVNFADARALRVKVKTKIIDMIGKTYGKLTVISRSGKIPIKGRPRGKVAWLCHCSCGNAIRTTGDKLRSGNTKTCGCGYARTKHGLHKSLEYRTWVSILARCGNPNLDCWKHYGGRGIQVTGRWRKFENFLKDMGPKPSLKHSIERINNNGNYEPGNCKWATFEEQANNKRTCVYISFDGRTLTSPQWSKIVGISTRAIWCRMKRGLSPVDILFLPPQGGLK